MLYLVIAYPRISRKDYQFIQEYRKNNDPKYFSLVRPHFTIVFPTPDITEKDFVSEIEKQTRNNNKFNFTIRCATINKDFTGDFYHEFLVPDEGYSNLVKLHDKLYSGILFNNLRFDIDFIPHIGIGNSEDVLVSKKRIDELNSQNLLIKGSIEELDIVKYENDKITSIKKVKLI